MRSNEAEMNLLSTTVHLYSQQSDRYRGSTRNSGPDSEWEIEAAEGWNWDDRGVQEAGSMNGCVGLERV